MVDSKEQKLENNFASVCYSMPNFENLVGKSLCTGDRLERPADFNKKKNNSIPQFDQIRLNYDASLLSDYAAAYLFVSFFYVGRQS